MSEKDAGKAGVVIGGVALVTAAIALAKDRVAKASPLPDGAGPLPDGVGPLMLDDATMQLLIAMAQTGADIEELAQQIFNALTGQQINVQVQGYPLNTEGIISGRVAIAAAGTPYQLPDIVVPDDMNFQIKGWPMNAGIIYVGGMRTSATNINQIWPLLANEAIGYRVKNADALYVSGTVAGDFAVYTVEQRRLGY